MRHHLYVDEDARRLFVIFRCPTEAEKQSALADLTHLAIAKCRGLYPPYSTDEAAENFQHAKHRKYTNRYTWIQLGYAVSLRTRPRMITVIFLYSGAAGDSMI